jgi:hypothetical protein
MPTRTSRPGTAIAYSDRSPPRKTAKPLLSRDRVFVRISSLLCENSYQILFSPLITAPLVTALTIDWAG